MQLPTGEWMTLPISDHSASEAFVTNGDIDWGSERLLDSLLNQQGVFLDIGAHIGYYSLYVLPHVLAVYSFEPDPRMRTFLEKNLSGRPKVEIIPSAVSASEGRARFTLAFHTEFSHLSQNEGEGESEIEVDVTTIDAFVASRGLAVEAIKIDAEDHDTEVIAGALKVLEEQKPLVLTEAKPNPALFALTHRIAYRVFAFVRNPRTRRKAFIELLADTPIPGETKMHFLVPDRLVDRFIELT